MDLKRSREYERNAGKICSDFKGIDPIYFDTRQSVCYNCCLEYVCRHYVRRGIEAAKMRFSKVKSFFSRLTSSELEE